MSGTPRSWPKSIEGEGWECRGGVPVKWDWKSWCLGIREVDYGHMVTQQGTGMAWKPVTMVTELIF